MEVDARSLDGLLIQALAMESGPLGATTDALGTPDMGSGCG